MLCLVHITASSSNLYNKKHNKCICMSIMYLSQLCTGFRLQSGTRDNLDDAKIIHEGGVAYSLLPINQSDTNQLKEPVSSCMRKRVDSAFIQNVLTKWRRLNGCGWLASHTAEKACDGLRLFWLVSLNKVAKPFIMSAISFHSIEGFSNGKMSSSC